MSKALPFGCPSYLYSNILVSEIEKMIFCISFTLKEDEQGVNPLIKVWNLDKVHVHEHYFIYSINDMVEFYQFKR